METTEAPAGTIAAGTLLLITGGDKYESSSLLVGRARCDLDLPALRAEWAAALPEWRRDIEYAPPELFARWLVEQNHIVPAEASTLRLEVWRTPEDAHADYLKPQPRVQDEWWWSEG